MKIGILGGGQLARMLVLASAQLGCEARVFAPPGDTCVEGLCPITRKRFDDEKALKQFFSDCDLVTYEWENLSLDTLRSASKEFPERLFPKLEVLEIISDRFVQKTFFRKNDLPTTEFVLIEKSEQLRDAIQEIGMPGILKTCRHGYDGKGQKLIRKAEDFSSAWKELGGVSLIYEKFISFERELSLIACRSSRGEISYYPLVENLHMEGILRKTIAPAEKTAKSLQDKAEYFAKQIAEHFNYVGVMALELFQCGNDLLINEMASRVHNTGHWTMDGAKTSQFENHLRAGLGKALGSTEKRSHTAMLNIIGDLPSLETIEKSIPGLFVHLYGKEPKLNRKLGHINVTAESFEQLDKKIKNFESLIKL